MKALPLIIIIVFIGSSCKKEEIQKTPQSQEIVKNLTGFIEVLNGNSTDYQVYSEIDNSEISPDNEFNIATHSVIYAINKNNDKPVYFGLPQKDNNSYLLNAKETALYFALLAIPNINNYKYNVNIDNFKSAVYELQEVKDLESKIKESVQEKGFLDYDEIGAVIGVTVDKVIDELGLLESAFTPRSPNWDDTYAAGRGFYRIDKKLPNNWEDEYEESTQTYRLKRKFYNNTPAVVGVKIEKYNFEENQVNIPLSGDYLGFIKPWYPPNLISVDGTWENMKSWGQATADLFSNGWDGFVNTDAYSSESTFEFEAKQDVKDAIVFTNGYYDTKVVGVNWIYLFASNFENIFKDQYPNLYTNEDFLFGFIEWMVQNNAISLGNYAVWGSQRQEDLIVKDLKEKLLNYVELDGIFNPNQNYILSEIIGKLNDAINKKFEVIAGSLGKVYKYSRKAYQVVGFLLTTTSPKFAAAIPLEFDDILTQPPFPYQPSPFDITLDNVSSYNFQWKVNNTNSQNLIYNLYLGEKDDELNLVASSISTTSFTLNNLLLNTRYYWQVEVINSSGQKSSGAIWTFDNGLVNEIGWFLDERDDQTYQYVQIGNQKWMKESLKYNSDNSFCYDNEASNCDNFGRLYPSTSQGICPKGWRIPTKEDWDLLLSNFPTEPFGFLKIDGYGGIDLGFTGTGNLSGTSFNAFDIAGYYLSSTKYEQNDNFIYALQIANGFATLGQFTKNTLFSCRCVEGEEQINGGPSNTGSFTDARDGQVYKTIQIGDQIWMAENLNIGTMLNGASDMTENGTIEKYCYNNDPSYCTTFGGLYQWDEMMQYTTIESNQGVCPTGWHLPSDDEWETLEMTLGGFDQGSQLAGHKSLWTHDWLVLDTDFGTSGFNAIPGGHSSNGSFYSKNNSAYFWTSTEKSASNAKRRYIHHHIWSLFQGEKSKSQGLSVRCVKD